MADLKYFIRPSQGFRAGDGYVEGGMMAGKEAEAGVGWWRGTYAFRCTLLQQWAKRCSLKETTKWFGVEGLRLTACVIELSHVGSGVTLTIISFFQTFVHLCKAKTATILRTFTGNYNECFHTMESRLLHVAAFLLMGYNGRREKLMSGLI